MDETRKPSCRICSETYPELFDFAAELKDTATRLLRAFNDRQPRLVDLKPHQRIFLFFLTRAIKTYSAIYKLCGDGYGQDAATLLRGFLENAISVEYMLSDESQRDQRAIRFVDYKWIILKRYIAEDPMESEAAQAQRALIQEHYEEYKKKYAISSDRGLLNWSGKSSRDMARAVPGGWLQEYDEVFRKYSRFSHPSIIGDSEYLDFETDQLLLSSQPSLSGVVVAVKHATDYLISFLMRFNELFALGAQDQLEQVRQKRKKMFEKKIYAVDYAKEKSLPPLNKESARAIRVRFSLP